MIRCLTLLFVCFSILLAGSLDARGVETIVIKDVQNARSLAGTATDRSGAFIPGVLVEERSSDWKSSLRSTTSDNTGHFSFDPVQGREIYYLQLSLDGFNQLQVRVKVDPKRGKALTLPMFLST